MNISDLIALSGISEKTKEQFHSVLQYAGLCGLLTDHQQKILHLKPSQDKPVIVKESLSKIICSGFYKISLQLATINRPEISEITLELLENIRIQLISEYGESGAALDKMMNKILTRHCNEMEIGNADLAYRFLEKITEKTSAIKAGNDQTKCGNKNFLHFDGSKAQKKETGSQLEKSGWFDKLLTLRKFFYNPAFYSVMFCKKDKLGHLALFFHYLFHEDLIHTDTGKCFMKMAAMHIVCNGEKVDERYMSKLCSNILADEKGNAKIIKEVQDMISEILKAV